MRARARCPCSRRCRSTGSRPTQPGRSRSRARGEHRASIDRDTLPGLDTLDRILLGATTYRLLAAFWPTPQSDGELVGPRLNALRKSVFSRTLDAAPWGGLAPATVERGDAVERVRALRRDEAYGDVVVSRYAPAP